MNGPRDTRNRKTRGRMLVGVVALACVIGLLAFLFGPLRQVTVPQIAGRSVQEATAMLAAANLRMDADGRDYSETVPKGQIISSDPEGGKSTRTGSTVIAIVSRGPERYDVPDLRGITAKEAEVALKATKLASGSITESYHDTVTKGDVISTDPNRGTSVKPNTAVNLTISKGPEPVPLPKLEGTSAVQASKTLTDLGIKVSITKRISESVPKGNVISMSPKGGTTVDKGSTVKIVESKGPPMVTVPNVVGKNRAEATAALEAVGFAVKVEYPLIFGTFDRVHSQTPGAGTSLPKGSTVTIDVV